VSSIGFVVALASVLASRGGTANKSDSRAVSNAPSYEVMARDVKGLGTVLVDGGGYTLYLFEPDDHASKSTCIDMCADEWPPLLHSPRHQGGAFWARRPSRSSGDDAARATEVRRPGRYGGRGLVSASGPNTFDIDR
jgi:predicted lipoprotein with Yx(FWY)xxD motif